MSFINRVTGQAVDELPAAILFGQWSFDHRIREEAKSSTGRQIAEGDILTPGIGINEKRVLPQTDDTIHSQFFADALPDKQNVEALMHFGQMLLGPEKAREGWTKWAEINPLAPKLDEIVKAHPLEDHIKDELNHLERVCRRPHTHIRVERERMPVSRAKRIAPQALVQLASHTEDWAYRKLTSVQPRRILADIREERWDLYENRVAVRLVDNLRVWLRRQIDEVRRVQTDIFEHMAKFDLYRTHHGRAYRICRLWGESWDASRRQKAAKDRLEQLQFLLRKIQGLMDSPLYQRIPRRTQVSSTLQATNLLNNDVHYRGVSRLWNHWARLAHSPIPSVHELHIRHQKLHRGFNAWCMLVIVRACTQLRLNPVEDNARGPEIQPDCVIQCNDDIRVKWESTGAVAFWKDDHILLRFVPLIHSLEQAQSAKAVKARVISLVDAMADTTPWTVFLHPARAGPPPYEAIAGIDNPPDLQQSSAVDFIRVSPFSLESVERIARAIRWVTLGSRMLAYPPAVPSYDQALINIQEIKDGTAVQPLKPEDLSEIENRLNQAKVQCDRLQQQRKQQTQSNKKKSSNSQLREARECVRKLKELKADLDCAQNTLIALATCPACGRRAEQFSGRDQNCFQAGCQSCESYWGLRLRPASESRIPVFLPKTNPDTSSWITDQEAAKVWVDDVFGCDVLAIPESWGSRRVRSFHAPRTEQFGDALKKLLADG